MERPVAAQPPLDHDLHVVGEKVSGASPRYTTGYVCSPSVISKVIVWEPTSRSMVPCTTRAPTFTPTSWIVGSTATLAASSDGVRKYTPVSLMLEAINTTTVPAIVPAPNRNFDLARIGLNISSGFRASNWANARQTGLRRGSRNL